MRRKSLAPLCVLFFTVFIAGFASGEEAAIDPATQQTAPKENGANAFFNMPVSEGTPTSDPQAFTPTSPVAEDRAEFDKKMAASAQRAADKRAAQNKTVSETPADAPPSNIKPLPLPPRAVVPTALQALTVEETLYTDEESFPRAASSHKKAVENYDFVTVFPEIAQTVELSNTENNRIKCNGVIQDVVFSSEKGIIQKDAGADTYIKFKIMRKSNGELIYAKNPTEIFIVCDGDTYHIIGLPKKRIQAQTIKLSSGKKKVLKKNRSLMAGLPMERKVMAFVSYVYKDAIPESFEIVSVNKKVKLFKPLNIVHKRTITIEGEGLLLKEFTITNKGDGQAILSEGLFLKPELTQNTLAVALADGKMNLSKNDSTRLYIIEFVVGGGTDFGQR